MNEVGNGSSSGARDQVTGASDQDVGKTENRDISRILSSSKGRPLTKVEKVFQKLVASADSVAKEKVLKMLTSRLGHKVSLSNSAKVIVSLVRELMDQK